MINKNNVFSGPNSLLDYYNPDKNPPTPLVEIPNHPFKSRGVRIYAKLMCSLPATNIKSLPALNMLLHAKETGKLNPNTKEIIEYSSGNTVISLAILGHIMGIPNVRAMISNKTTDEKIKLLRFFGLDLTMYPGPPQPRPSDPLGGIQDAVNLGKQPHKFTPNQYENEMNFKAHMRWTGPQIIKQIPDIAVLACPVGTSGSVTGTGLYLKKEKPETVVVGVCTAPGNQTPGPRTLELIQSIGFPWRDAVDCIEEVGSQESFIMAMNLCRMGILCGPSSGQSLCGLYSYLRHMEDENKLDSLRNSKGEVQAVFMCMDAPMQYMSEFFENIPESLFKPIRNIELKGVDIYPYVLAWEISSKQADDIIIRSTSPETIQAPVLIIDIRASEDTSKHPLVVLRHAQNMPLPVVIPLDVGSSSTNPNPYLDPPTMVIQWKTLDNRLHNQFDPVFGDSILKGKIIICTCYTGGTARAAVPILRDRGLEAYSVIEGLKEWCNRSAAVSIRRGIGTAKL